MPDYSNGAIYKLEPTIYYDEVHSAEVKVCLSARKAPIALPLSHQRL